MVIAIVVITTTIIIIIIIIIIVIIIVIVIIIIIFIAYMYDRYYTQCSTSCVPAWAADHTRSFSYRLFMQHADGCMALANLLGCTRGHKLCTC